MRVTLRHNMLLTGVEDKYPNWHDSCKMSIVSEVTANTRPCLFKHLQIHSSKRHECVGAFKSRSAGYSCSKVDPEQQHTTTWVVGCGSTALTQPYAHASVNARAKPQTVSSMFTGVEPIKSLCSPVYLIGTACRCSSRLSVGTVCARS